MNIDQHQQQKQHSVKAFKHKMVMYKRSIHILYYNSYIYFILYPFWGFQHYMSNINTKRHM